MIWSPIVRTGFRLVIGSWKIIAISPPRIFRSLLDRQREQVAAFEPDLPAGDLARRFVDEPHDGERGHALARAGLADDREAAAALDGEVDAVDGLDDPVEDLEVGLEVANLEQVVPVRRAVSARSSRAPSIRRSSHA